MTKEDFKLAEDLLAQINKIEDIKIRIRNEYTRADHRLQEADYNTIRELLNDCNNICYALKEIKEKQFENL